MILSTTNNIEGHQIIDYLGIVTGVSVNAQKTTFTFKKETYFASLEESINEAKEEAFQKLKENASKLSANAVVGIKIDIETFPQSTFLLVSITGTAVKVQ